MAPHASTIHSETTIHKVALIPGDGIGVDVTQAAVQVLEKLSSVLKSFEFEFVTFDWNSKNYQERGHYIPPNGFDELKKFDSIYFGAVGSPGKWSE
jgi:isocitrate/isopropylmalate dehydrogenase